MLLETIVRPGAARFFICEKQMSSKRTTASDDSYATRLIRPVHASNDNESRSVEERLAALESTVERLLTEQQMHWKNQGKTEVLTEVVHRQWDLLSTKY
jgi:hypothetical protein